MVLTFVVHSSDALARQKRAPPLDIHARKLAPELALEPGQPQGGPLPIPLSDRQECTICCEALESSIDSCSAQDSGMTINRTPCGHMFHHECLQCWCTQCSLERKGVATCPVCRAVLLSDPVIESSSRAVHGETSVATTAVGTHSAYLSYAYELAAMGVDLPLDSEPSTAFSLNLSTEFFDLDLPEFDDVPNVRAMRFAVAAHHAASAHRPRWQTAAVSHALMSSAPTTCTLPYLLLP